MAQPSLVFHLDMMQLELYQLNIPSYGAFDIIIWRLFQKLDLSGRWRRRYHSQEIEPRHELHFCSSEISIWEFMVDSGFVMWRSIISYCSTQSVPYLWRGGPRVITGARRSTTSTCDHCISCTKYRAAKSFIYELVLHKHVRAQDHSSGR